MQYTSTSDQIACWKTHFPIITTDAYCSDEAKTKHQMLQAVRALLGHVGTTVAISCHDNFHDRKHLAIMVVADKKTM